LNNGSGVDINDAGVDGVCDTTTTKAIDNT